jgi:peptidoglycan endopeptidase LytE
MTAAQKENLVKIAQSLIGKPYKYGAKPEEAPNFFDCSSFTQYVFKQIGIELPRSTIEQASCGIEVSLDQIEVGDLIFVHGKYGHYNPSFPQGIGHVGIYIGNQEVIHAASERVKEQPIIEKGKVIKSFLKDFIETRAPLVTIKRF